MPISYQKIRENNQCSINIVHSISLFIIPIIVFISLLNLKHTYQVCAYLITFALLFLRTPFEYKFSRIDLSLALITLSWILSPIWSICHTPSIRAAEFAVLLYGFYLLVRIVTFQNENRTKAINHLSLVFVIVELLAILTFIVHYNESIRLGFKDLYSIRYLFRPFAETNNCWAQISLIGTAICVLSTQYKFIYTYICSIGTLLTFSRGAYIVLILMVATLSCWNYKNRTLKAPIIGILLGFISISIIFPHEFLTVISITATESQQKSLAWRKTSSNRSLEEFSAHPFLGTGSRSYSMVCNEFNSSESSFSNYPPNIISEIIIEKGIIGFFIYILLLLQIVQHIVKYKENTTSAIISSLILLILLKDLTQGTLHSSSVGSLLFIFLLAVSQSTQTTSQIRQQRNSLFNIVTGILVLISTLIPKDLFRTNVEKNIMAFISELHKGEYLLAENSISSTLSELSNHDPYPRIILANIFIIQNRHTEAKTIIDEIGINSGYTEFLNGVICLHESDTIKAIAHLSNALYQVPSLATCIEYRQLDPMVKFSVLDKTLNALNCYDTTQEAMTGALLYYNGFKHEAQPHLKSAILRNSTLQLPYKLLGDNDKYEFLCHGALLLSHENKNNHIYPQLIELLLQEYSPRFRIWYSI